MTPIGLTWTQISSFATQRNSPLMYYVDNNHYFIFLSDGPLVFETRIRIDSPANADQTDFQDNFKPGIDANEMPIGTKIIGSDGTLAVDVALVDGNPSVRTFGIQAIESLRGFDPIADVWLFIGTEGDSVGAGEIGDTVRVEIVVGDNGTLFPAVDVTTTLTATEAGDETALGNKIVSDLNADVNFSLNYFARRIEEDAVTVYITARQPGPRGERSNIDDFKVTTTGTTTATRAFDRITRRNKVTSLARDPANPTLGILGISGSVTAGEGDVTGRIIEFAKNGGGSEDLKVDGSGTPEEFRIEASPDKERFFTSLRFEALGNGIQFTNFLSKNGALANGVMVKIRSNDSEIIFPLVTTTEDFASIFSRGPSDFDLFDVAGTDYFRSTLTFAAPFQLFKQGTFSTDDFISITVRDDLSVGLTQFRFIGFGFEREF